MDSLASWIVTHSKPILEEWMPKVIANIKSVFEEPDNKAALERIGEIIAGALVQGMVSGVKGLVKSIEPAKWFSASGILFDPEPIDWKGIFGLDSGTDANTSDVKVSAKDSSAYEAEAYRSTNTGDTFNFNYPTLNGVHNLSDLVEEMAKLKQISDRAGGAFS